MIPSLEDLSLGHRIMVTLAIVLVILFGLALFGFLTGGWEVQGAPKDASRPEDIPISKYEERLVVLDRNAIEAAYHDQIKLLFQNWMKDVNDKSQPGRALTGTNHARDAFTRSIAAIEKRERWLKENAPASQPR
jgi:hypothetical protein